MSEETGRDSELHAASQPTVYRGTSSDITALLATAVGLLALLTYGTMGSFIYCLPILPLILGIAGLASARRSVAPDRTRLLSWIGVGTGGFALLVMVALFIFVMLIMLFSFVFPLMMLAMTPELRGY